MEQYVIKVLAGLTVLVLGALFGEPLWWALSGLARIGSPDLPRISGEWTATFLEPNESGVPESMTETINLHQIGRLVWGKGAVSDTPARAFTYKGSILRNTLRGTYSRTGQNSPSGTGTFQVLIAGSDDSMSGWCIWYDRDTHIVEASRYQWTRSRA